LTWLVLVSVYSFLQLVTGSIPLLSWLGLTLSAIAPLGFFVNVFLFRSPRTSRYLFEYTLLSGLGMAITLAISFRHGTAAGLIHVWAGLTLIGWVTYLRWYSDFGTRDSAELHVGSPLPDFRLQSMEGHVVSSESFKAKPHLLVFYRGNWCPFCVAQITELAAAYRHLQALGVSVVLISPQPVDKSQKMANRLGAPLLFLRDRNNKAARTLGILNSWGVPMGTQLLGYDSDTVMPTVVITDKNGHIIFCDQTDNYRIRPEPETFASMIKSLRPEKPGSNDIGHVMRSPDT
jgi:peroxiredoxin